MADDIASLGFAVDSSQVVAGTAALDRMAASAKNASNESQRIGQSHTLAATATQRLAREQQLAVAVNRASILAQAELGDKVELLSRATDNAYRSLSTRSFFRLLAREASLAGGPLAQMIGHFGILNVGGQRLGVGVTAGTLAIAALTAVAVKAVEAFVALEIQQIKTANALMLTKGASGQTVAELEELAQRLAANGTQSLADIRAAENELLKFKSVGSSSFSQVMQLAKDLAATGFADLKSGATAIGKALQDPTKATEALADVGLRLSVAEQRLASDLYAAGKAAQAKAVILKALSTQVSGADAAAADTLDAAWRRVTGSSTTLLEVWGKQIVEGLRLKSVLDGIASALPKVDEVQQAAENQATLRELARHNRAGTLVNGALPAKPASAGDSFSTRFDAAGIEAASKAVRDLNADMTERKKRIDEVNDALLIESRTSGMSAVQQQVYMLAVKAGVDGDKAATDAIRAKVNAIASANETRQITDQIKQQTVAQQIEAQTIGMAVGPAIEYRTAQEALAQARIKNIALGPAQIDAIKKEAAALGEATQAAESSRIASNVKFDRQTMFLSDEDVKIAQQLRSLYGDDVPRALASTEAAALRANLRMKDMRDIIKNAAEEFTKGFVSNLMQGKSAMDSMVLSARNLSQALANQAITEAFKGNFIGAAASGIGALISGIFGKKQTSEEKRAIIQQQQQLAEEQARVAQQAADEQIRIQQAAADEQARIAKDLAARQLSFQDQLFDATNDNSTLEGKLAALDREANQARQQEAASGNGAIVDLEESFGARRLRIQTDFNREAIESEQRAARERQDAINSAAKNVIDYVNGLLAGQNSTLSPQTKLTNAQSLYNTKLTAALGGNIDAQASITQDADNLLKAARDVFASSSAYQDLQTQVISQLLSLHAVSSTTDPLLQAMRDTLAAINDGNSKQALDATLNNVIKTAIDAGNAGAIAALLVPKFDQLDVTGNKALDFNEFVVGLGPAGAGLATDGKVAGLLTDAQLRAAGIDVHGPLTNDQITALGLTKEQGNALNIFRELDTNGDGQLQRDELLRGRVADVHDVIGALDNTTNVKLNQANANTAAANTLQVTTNAILDFIHTGTDRLIDINSVIGFVRANTASTASSARGIYYHTGIVPLNTKGPDDLGGPALALGGVIPPFGMALVSEHSPGGGRFLRAGAEPITVSPFAPSNDNSALASEVRALREEVAAFRRENGVNTMSAARHIGEKVEESSDAVADGLSRVAFETRNAARKNAA